MDVLSANTTNHRRIIMAIATVAFGVLMSLLVYKTPLTFREFLFPSIVGLAVFELLFRTRDRLMPVTLPFYIVVVLIGSEIVYGLLYGLSYGYIWSPITAFQNLYSEYPYNLYALIDSSIMTGMAYFLIKVYRVDTWELSSLQSVNEMGNEPVLEDGPMTFEKWLKKNQQQIWGFFGWFVIASVLAPFSFGLITTPLTVIILISFALSKERKGIAGGILVAVSLNFFLALARGLQTNAWCFMPFYIDSLW